MIEPIRKKIVGEVWPIHVSGKDFALVCRVLNQAIAKVNELVSEVNALRLESSERKRIEVGKPTS